MQSTEENLLVIDSSYRTQDASGSSTKFEVQYRGAVHFHAAEHVRVKTISVPNLFANVYGSGSEMWYTVNGTLKYYKLPEAGRYTLTQLVAKLNTESVGVDIAFTVQAASAANYNLERVEVIARNVGETIVFPTTDEINDLRGGRARGQPSLLSLLGFGPSSTSYTLPLSTGSVEAAPYPPSLFGPQTVYFKSDKLALGHSIVPSGNIDSIFTFIHLEKPYGSICTRTISDHFSDSIFFPSEVDCNTIDIKLVDEYDQQLALPANSNVQLQLIIGNGTANM